MWTEEEQRAWKTFYPALFKAGRDSFAGFPTGRITKGVFEASVEEREALFENLWARGGFNYSLGNYFNISIDPEANKVRTSYYVVHQS